MDTSSNLAVNLMPFLIMSSFSNLATFSWLLQDDFLILIGDILFPFSRDVPSYHPSSTSCPLSPLFSPLGNFITFEHLDHSPSTGCLLFLLLSLPSNFTTSDHLPSPGYPFFFLRPLAILFLIILLALVCFLLSHSFAILSIIGKLYITLACQA